MSNRFDTEEGTETLDRIPQKDTSKSQAENSPPELKSDIVQNLSTRRISIAEQRVLEKGLNFCPTSKHPKRISVLDDLYFFCRKLRLKEFFYSPPNSDEVGVENNSEKEQCELNTRIANPYFNPSTRPPDALATYISAIKKDVTQSIKSPSNHRSNLTIEERQALKDLSEDDGIVIKPADKGGKVVVMDRNDYKQECERNLGDQSFYTRLDDDPNEAW